MPMKRFWVKKLIIVWLLVGSVLGTFHHHEDHEPHHECQLCVLQANLGSADIPDTFSLPQIDAVYPLIPDFSIQSIPTLIIRFYFSRAPPRFF